jgi:hypothetical protein
MKAMLYDMQAFSQGPKRGHPILVQRYIYIRENVPLENLWSLRFFMSVSVPTSFEIFQTHLALWVCAAMLLYLTKNTLVQISLGNLEMYQYTLSIITSQLHCFQLRTSLNGKDFKFFSHGLCTEKQNILSSTHVCMKNNYLFWPINVEISFNTKTRLQVIPYLLIKIQKYFSRMCWRRSMFCFSVHNPWEKTWNPFHLRWS